MKKRTRKTKCKFLMAHSSKESECNETLEEGHYEVSRNKYERESYGNIHTLNYAYMQHLDILFGTLQIAT